MTNANQRLIWACFALVVITISDVVNMLTVTFDDDHTQLLRKAKQFMLHWWKIVAVTLDDDHTQVLRKAKQSLLHWWKIVTVTFDDDHIPY